MSAHLLNFKKRTRQTRTLCSPCSVDEAGEDLRRGASENMIGAQVAGFEEDTQAGDGGQCQRGDQKEEAGEEKRLRSHTLRVASAWLLDRWCPERRNTGAETNVGSFRRQATFR